MSDFFAMGGYAQYVWPCYGIVFVVLVTVLGLSLKNLARQKKELKMMEIVLEEGTK